MESQYSEQPGLIPSQQPDPQAGLIPVQSPHEPKFGGYGYGALPVEAVPAERRILGLRATTFWLLLALAVVVVAAAVGGGVGGSLAVNNAKNACLSSASAAAAAPPTSTTSSSFSSGTTATPSGDATLTLALPTDRTTTAWGPLQTKVPYTDCPSINGTIYQSYFPNSFFKIYCGLDITFASNTDLLYLVTPTFELCMEACSSFNDQGKAVGGVQTPCAGIAFIPTHVNGDGSGMPADCVLKAGSNVVDSLVVNKNYLVDSAILQ